MKNKTEKRVKKLHNKSVHFLHFQYLLNFHYRFDSCSRGHMILILSVPNDYLR